MRRPILLYDGACPFCRSQSARLERMAGGPDRVERRSFREPGAFDGVPKSVTPETCEGALQLVEPDGRVSSGFEGVVRLLRRTRPVLGRLALAYYIPGVRWLTDRAYAWVALNRFRFFGRLPADETAAGGECPTGACELHPHPVRASMKATD